MTKDKEFRPAGPTSQEVEKIFAKVDETGHRNEEKARKQRRRRKELGASIEVDPLSEDDPSGSVVSKTIARTAIGFVVVILLVVVLAQVSCGVMRRVNTAILSQNVSIQTVTSALKGGVEWGNGFTQFPDDFTVEEADENTGRVEVSVIDTSSKDEMDCFAGSQIQATAFSVNALLNPKITTVIYHVKVHVNDEGKFQQSQFFGFLKPTGGLKSFMTFIWTKNVTRDGSFNLNCNITGMDSETAASLRDKVTSFSNNPIVNVFNRTASSSTTAATPTTEPGTAATPTTEPGTAATPTTEPGTAATPTTEPGTAATPTTEPGDAEGSPAQSSP